MKNKLQRKLICLALSVLMILSVCGSLASLAADYEAAETDAYAVANGVTYHQYRITSGVANGKANGYALSFSSKDYMVLTYSGAAGGSLTPEKQYERALAEGYEVVGVINGSFFSMDSGSQKYGNYGYLNEYVVANGVVASADNDNAAAMIGINSDGTLVDIPNSTVHYALYLNGVESAGGLRSINKTAGSMVADNWSNQFYYFDEHAGYNSSSLSQAMTYAICPGYEILCEKLNDTDLMIDSTLEAKVLEVRKNSYGTKIGKNQFVLFVRADSPFAAEAEALKAGSEVRITATETIADAVGKTSAATSLIANVGYLVKDGVNLVSQPAFNSTDPHGNKYLAAWTAIGVTEDGSWVFFTSDNTKALGKVTMQDVAKVMVEELHCKTVIRMDGGGSSAMYVSNDGTGKAGYKMHAEGSYVRPVGDCIMIVKRTGAASDAALKTKLTELVNEYASQQSNPYVEVVAQANAILTSTSSSTADYRRAYQAIRSVRSSYEQLDVLIAAAEKAKETDYAATVWKSLQAALASAKTVKGDSKVSVQTLLSAVRDLSVQLTRTGTYIENVARNRPYTSSLTPNPAYPDTDGKELTDGLYASASDGKAPGWSGYNPNAPVLTVDLGTKLSDLKKFNLRALSLASWGILYPKSVKIEVSDDNQTFREVGTVAPSDLPKAEGAVYDYTLTLEQAVSARYVRFTVLKGGTFTFLCELEVFRYEEPGAAILPGDLNNDGELGARDYIMLKRAVLGLIKLNAAQEAAADLNGDGKVNSRDYIILKRSILLK